MEPSLSGAARAGVRRGTAGWCSLQRVLVLAVLRPGIVTSSLSSIAARPQRFATVTRGNLVDVLAIAALLTAILVSLLVTRIATVWLTVSGMAREAARFQARSAFTGVGFTTREAEQVVNHPVRRRVVMFLMLLGNAGIVTVLGSLIVGFGGERTTSALLLRVGVVLVGLLVLWFVSRSARVDRALGRLAARVMKRRYGTDAPDRAHLLAIAGEWYVSELFVREGDWLAGRKISEQKLRAEGVSVLGVTRAKGAYLPWPDGDTTLFAGDTLIVYGRDSRLAELDSRRADGDGVRAHERAKVSHHERAGGVQPDGHELRADPSK